MKIFKSAKSVQNYILSLKRQGRRIGFVPTMGCLHDGHLSLIKRARKDNDVVVLSIFINPIQFGPNEDYKHYPRSLKMDLMLARNGGVDVVYYPDSREMYTEDHCTYVEVNGISEVLCGEFRPGHFKGVTTVCAKLFNIVQPDIVYLGKKDYQQAIIIKQMVKNLNMPLRIKIVPIVREKDGLAISSRNRNLTKGNRKQALVIFKSLQTVRGLVKDGVKDTGKIKSKVENIISNMPGIKVEYIRVVDLKLLQPVAVIKKPVLLAIVVWIKKVRLIDNIILKP
ncbi:MAG: pantoate--beta-alanine ligase [Candidatus Saelkia tenebricola]|nr:pantoate--beta-alanine ligase [Candidatus Saelkia tenebricola]